MKKLTAEKIEDKKITEVTSPQFIIAPKDVAELKKKLTPAPAPVKADTSKFAKKDDQPKSQSDLRSQIQSIVASIQPALQKAIGSHNNAKIQVIITDKDEADSKKTPDNKPQPAQAAPQQSAPAAKPEKKELPPLPPLIAAPEQPKLSGNNITLTGKNFIGANSTMAVSNITISA